MSQTQTNNAYVTKSCNGIISVEDGAGGLMEGGVITANELVIDAIQSKSPPNVVSLFTDTTTIINMGSSTSVLNVSNLNVSNINLPVITFTTLNVSNANASISNSSTSNSSTSNSSTSNSSTSNSSTSNSSTSNSSTSNSDTANNGTTNSSTINVSTLNFGTTSGTTINMSTVNASIVNVNNIQGITATDDIYLYTNTTGIITLGDTNTSLTHLKGSNILLESAGDTYLQTPNNLYLSTLGDTTINGSSLLIGANTAYTIGNITLGNVSTNFLLLDAKNTTISAVNDNTIDAGGDIYLLSNGNTEICNGGYGGKLVLSGNQEIRAKDRSMPSYLFTDSFSGGDVYFGNASNTLYLNCSLSSSKSIKGGDLIGTTLNISTTANISTLNVSTLNASTTTFGIINNTTINTSTLNVSTANISTLKAINVSATNINASYISTPEIYADYAELGTIAFSNETISVLDNTATVSLFPALTTGTINLATNVTTSGAITIGNAAATGSFSVSEGTININPKTTLNIANQILNGTSNICNSNGYRGTLNIASTANVSNASTNTINIASSTTSALNFGCPLTPNYNSFYSATTGITRSSGIGYQIIGNMSSGGSFSTTNGTVATTIGSIALTIGVWIINFVALFSNTTSTAIADFDFISLRVGTTLNGTDVYMNSFFGGGQLRGLGLKGDAQNLTFSIVYTATTAQTLFLSARAKSLNVTSINKNVAGTGASDDGPAEITAVRIA